MLVHLDFYKRKIHLEVVAQVVVALEVVLIQVLVGMYMEM